MSRLGNVAAPGARYLCPDICILPLQRQRAVEEQQNQAAPTAERALTNIISSLLRHR